MIGFHSNAVFPILIPRFLRCGAAISCSSPSPDAAKLPIATSCRTLPGPRSLLHISLFPGRSQPPRIGGVSLSLPHTPSWQPGHPLMARLAGKGDVLKLQSISTQVFHLLVVSGISTMSLKIEILKVRRLWYFNRRPTYLCTFNV